MIKKIFIAIYLFFLLSILGTFLFKTPIYAANEFGTCSLINKPTRLDYASNLFPKDITIDTNGKAVPGGEYNILLLKPDRYYRGIPIPIKLKDLSGKLRVFNADPDTKIVIPFYFDREGKTYSEESVNSAPKTGLGGGSFYIGVTDAGNSTNKCQAIPDSTGAMEIEVSFTPLPENPPSTNSCPLCPDGYAWNYQYNMCQKDTDYKHSIERVNCSSQGSRCVAGEGYCENPGTSEICKERLAVNSSCNPELKDPGDCKDGLICQTQSDGSGKCYRPLTGTGTTCYKCRSSSEWDGTKCVGPLATDPKACIEPETREYCASGFSCSQGRGCITNPQDGDEVEKPQPLKTPCEKSLTGVVTGQCYGVFSGLGIRLPTNPLLLIPQILEVILGFAGAIVIILIIRSGYKLMFSQGNPEKVQEARDELTSAIVGLLFIIFSFVLLQFIVNDFLKLETLTSGKTILEGK